MMIGIGLALLTHAKYTYAQTTPISELLQLEQEEKEDFLSTGQGPRNRYTNSQSQLVAWQFMTYARPTEILNLQTYRNDQRLYHVVTIEVADGSIYEVTVNALMGRVQWVNIDFLGENPIMPDDALPREQAIEIAKQAVKEQTRGVSRPRVKDARLALFKKKIAHQISIKKAQRFYDVFIPIPLAPNDSAASRPIIIEQ